MPPFLSAFLLSVNVLPLLWDQENTSITLLHLFWAGRSALEKMWDLEGSFAALWVSLTDSDATESSTRLCQSR
jgi:hypothetical protein